MRITSITTKFAVMSQPQESDFAILADLGTRLLINNRADNEEPHQRHSFSEAREASRNSISYLQLIIRIEAITDTDVAKLRHAIATADGLERLTERARTARLGVGGNGTSASAR